MKDYETVYDPLKKLCQLDRVVYLNDHNILWQFPAVVFTVFAEIYILTYLFENSLLHDYLSAYNFQYEYRSIASDTSGYYLTKHFDPDTSKYQELINIYDGRLNQEEYNSIFSASWYDNAGPEAIKAVKDNTYNYIHNLMRAKNQDIMWCCYKQYAKKVCGKGYGYIDPDKLPPGKLPTFVSYNARASNQFSGKHTLAYLINVYPSPAFTYYFSGKGIKVDSDSYALSCLVQWIFRSAVRKNEPVNLYLPSARMRYLLKRWMGVDESKEIKVRTTPVLKLEKTSTK